MATRPITDTLRDLRNGLLLDEMSEQMKELVNAVESTGKAGAMTLKIEIKPMKDMDGAIVIKDTVTMRMPKIESSGTVLFVTPEGNTSRRNQRQDELPGITLASDNGQTAKAS